MAANPRIDELRKKIEKDPGSRLFAQLAEELRKDGDLEEAIRVAREGLYRHPNYPSARMTLGRAYQDTGDWARARTEFEQVLKGAPDNILASRYLAECLENLGDTPGAIQRYKATLVLAPGDKHVLARLAVLEGTAKPPAPSPTPVSAPKPVAAPAAAPRSPERPPIAVATVDTPMELERSLERTQIMPAPPMPEAPAPPETAPESRPEPPPIPVVSADEDFELEQPYEPPVRPLAAAPPPPPPPSPPETEGITEYEFDSAPTLVQAAPPPVPAPIEEPPTVDVLAEPEEPPPAPAAEEPPPPPAPEEPLAAPAAEAPADLTSPTLAELYFNQGFTDKAIEVYRQILDREPGNERFRARLKELEDFARHMEEPAPAPSAAPPAAAPSPVPDRRQAIERTIARLESFLAAVRRE